ETFWTVIRPQSQIGDGHNRVLRVKFEVPAELGYTVSDISLPNNRKILYGGDLADRITMMLVGVADRINQIHVDPVGCPSHGCKSQLNTKYYQTVKAGLPCSLLGAYQEAGPAQAAQPNLSSFSRPPGMLSLQVPQTLRAMTLASRLTRNA